MELELLMTMLLNEQLFIAHCQEYLLGTSYFQSWWTWLWNGPGSREFAAKDDKPVLMENLKKIWKKDTNPLSNVIMLIKDW